MLSKKCHKIIIKMRILRAGGLCMDVCTSNNHYLNLLLEKVSESANKTIAPLGDFKINLLNFDTSDHISAYSSS